MFAEASRQIHFVRYQGFVFIAGVADHDSLVSSSAFIHAFGNFGRLGHKVDIAFKVASDPAEVMAHGPPYAAVMLNLTNDAWFGQSSGPYQHFASARMRSVEFGVPMVRSANNGLSAIIDGYGRIIASLGLDAVGFVEGPLPLPVAGPPTAYSRFGDAPALLLIVFSFGLARLSWHRSRNG